MKKAAILLLILTTAIYSGAQKKNEWKNLNQTEHIVRTLAADEMVGRLVFTEEIDRAAAFIADEFKKAGLQTWDGKSFFQSFTMDQINLVSVNATINGEEINGKSVFAFSNRDLLTSNDKSFDFDTAYISKTDTFFLKLGALRRSQKKNLVVFVDTSHRRFFNISKSFHNKYYSGFREYNSFYYSDKETVVILTDKKPKAWSIEYRQRIEKKGLQNVVGILPGKKFEEQKIVFSAHYDHLGIGKPNNEGDSIYNGANDDASGVAAIIQLAHHFCKQRNNERSLVFSAFTFEEAGGIGAIYFTKLYDSSSIIANFNIEMIGTVAEAGPGTAVITGYEFSDFGRILQKNLENSGYQFLPDPHKELESFYNSDNITFARKGVPAHTISTSRGTKEPYWHTPDDEWEKFDFNNMNEIIKAIATSAGTMINGKDTPTRIDIKQLRQ